MSLNVRVAEEVIGYICRTGWDPKRVQRYVKRLVNNSPPHRRKVGRALTDEDVAAFILRATKREPIGWTRSLRLLRRSGAACEQVRFRKIFRRVEARS